MQRVRIAILGAGAATEWAVLPVLSGPDIGAPPDTGAWWSRRPAPGGDIRYQSAARPEVAALFDGDEKRLQSVGGAARVPALYRDWRQMLREIAPEALLWPHEEKSSIPVLEVVREAAKNGVRWLWLEGPIASSTAELQELSRALAGRAIHLWPASPLRHAAAHRAARRLIERDGIGPIAALQLRWPAPFDEAHQAPSYAALDLLLSFVPGAAGAPKTVVAGGRDGMASLWLQWANDLTATVLFGAADSWSGPLPRLEIAGSQGRYLVCEAGRKLLHFVPREATRLWEPPGLAPHVSAPNLAGVSEDLKAFLAACVGAAPLLGAETALFEPARAVALLQTAENALQSGQMESVIIPVLSGGAPDKTIVSPNQTAGAPENLTLFLE